MMTPSSPLRLTLSRDALVHNWRWLAARGGAAATGAAIKSDGYGLGARAVMQHLFAAGCRDFFVATWAEAAALMPLPPGASLAVLHGVRAEDMAAATSLPARPVLVNAEQVQRWRSAGPGLACDVMVDTGMNRLGLPRDAVAAGALDGLAIHTLHSHLACADEDSPENARQLADFCALAPMVRAQRYSLANSAGICLGPDYGFDLTRPGIALYGGIPRTEAQGHIRPVAGITAQVLQVRDVPAGASVGYGATWTARRPSRIATAHLGYADGYWRAMAGQGWGMWQGRRVPLVGRVSMDLTGFDVTDAPGLAPGDWIDVDFDLGRISRTTGMTAYELLTGLGPRFERHWI